MPPKAESSTAYREPTVQEDDDDDFDDLDGTLPRSSQRERPER